jgi:hypothetical protein
MTWSEDQPFIFLSVSVWCDFVFTVLYTFSLYGLCFGGLVGLLVVLPDARILYIACIDCFGFTCICTGDLHVATSYFILRLACTDMISGYSVPSSYSSSLVFSILGSAESTPMESSAR